MVKMADQFPRALDVRTWPSEVYGKNFIAKAGTFSKREIGEAISMQEIANATIRSKMDIRTLTNWNIV
jgi:hypothetical protein